MGIYDRDYVRDDEPQTRFSGPRTIVGTLIVINVVVYLADWLLFGHQLSEYFGLPYDWYQHAWKFWQPLTYGFVHDQDLRHVLFNMICLFFFGPEMEQLYGRREFLLVYLAMIVFSGLAWAGIHYFQSPTWPVVGASGGVIGVLTLFALNYPQRQILLLGFIPMPAWLMCALCILLDLTFNRTRVDKHIAWEAHLAGASFAAAYWYLGWKLENLVPSRFSKLAWWRRPRLRVHTPTTDDDLANLQARVDQILEKWSQQGEESLTAEERRFLESASRKYQQRKR